MKGWWLGLLLAVALPACSERGGSRSQRVEVRPVGPSSVQLVPTAGQLPYCLAFTVSELGAIRQLTMAPNRQAVPCSADAPISGLTFRIPAEEGKVQILVVFSDQPVKADPIAAQVFEFASAKRQITPLDLRAPGKVVLETVEFTPSSDPAPETVEGDVVTRGDGGIPDDASTPP